MFQIFIENKKILWSKVVFYEDGSVQLCDWVRGRDLRWDVSGPELRGAARDRSYDYVGKGEKVCGRKYGDLIIVITKLILNNQGNFQTKPKNIFILSSEFLPRAYIDWLILWQIYSLCLSAFYFVQVYLYFFIVISQIAFI